MTSTASQPQIRVIFFASLREAVGINELNVTAHSLDDLLNSLRTTLNQDAVAALTAENVRIAINQTLLSPGEIPHFTAGDEVAFLPPVTGG